MSLWADSRSSPRYRPKCLRSAIRRKLCSIRRTRTFTWTTCASREPRHDGQADRQSRVVFRSASRRDRGLQRHHPTDDGRELLRAGHLRQQPVLLERRRLVQRAARSFDGPRRPFLRCARAQHHLLADHPRDRGAAGGPGCAVHAEGGGRSRRDPGRARAAAARALERRRHHLADLRAQRHRPSRLDSQSPGSRLQLYGRLLLRLVHDHRHGRLALDEPDRASLLRGPKVDSGSLLSGGADRRRVALVGVPLDRIAEAEPRAFDRRAAALHGQFHDLHRAFRRHRGRPRQFDDNGVDRPRQDRARPVRPRQGRGPVDCLQPDHPRALLGLLHGHAQQRFEPQGDRVMTRRVILIAYIVFLIVPIYWLINMSFKTNTEITTTMSIVPTAPTLKNYAEIFTNPTWYGGFRFSLTYVVLNTIISIGIALPAAYAFSRHHFLGDKHL